MQHESSISPPERGQTSELSICHSFHCTIGDGAVRLLLEAVAAKIKAVNPQETSLSRNTQIVLAEVLNNIEEHGYQGVDGGQIKLELQILDDCIAIETTDFGKSMPGLELPAGTLPDTRVGKEDLPEGGFGWFLIHTLAPNPVYIRRGNTNILQIKILNSES